MLLHHKKTLSVHSTLVWLLALAACGSEPTTAGPANSGGLNRTEVTLVMLRSVGSGDYDSSGVGGVIVIDRGCVYLQGEVGNRTAVVWPPGSSWNNASGFITVADGPDLQSGDAFNAIGTYATVGIAASELDPTAIDLLDKCDEGDVALVRGGVMRVEMTGSIPPDSPG